MEFLRSNRLDLLIAIYIFCVVAVNLMGAKVMPLGQLLGMEFNIGVGIFLMPLLFSIIDVICEVHGKARARNVVHVGMVVIFLMVLFSTLAVAMPAAERFAVAEAYNTVFAISVRFGMASLVAFGLSGLLDVLVYNKLKMIHGKGRLVWLRNNLSGYLGQLVDSTVFVFIAFYSFDYGFVENVSWLTGIILPWTLAKCTMSAVTTPLVYLGIRFLEGKKLVGEKESVPWKARLISS